MTTCKPVKVFFQNLPAQPRNSTHIGGRILTPLARAFKDDIQERLERTKLRNHFQACTAIKLFLTAYTPYETFVTKAGIVSKTSIDFDAHKLLIDEVSKFFGFNDGLITEFEYEKKPIDGPWCFEITIIDWSNEVCLSPLPEDTVSGTLSSQGYLILN